MRIDYHSETEFTLPNQEEYTEWIIRVLTARELEPGELQYIFCSDKYLLDMNQKYLGHDYYTDILTFENDAGEGVSGDLFLSIDRIRENAETYNVPFMEELARVMIHGVLHLIGYGDQTEDEKKVMRREEAACLEMFHVKQ